MKTLLFTLTATMILNLIRSQDTDTLFTVTTIITPAESGQVTGGGEYKMGQPVTLQATANSGFYFRSWSINGIVVDTTPRYDFITTAPITVQANFRQASEHYTVTTSYHPSEGGITSGQGEYSEGDTAFLHAIPSPGFSFHSWSIYGILVTTNPDYQHLVQGNVQLNAHFIHTTPVYSVSTTSYPAEGGTTIGQGEYTEGDTAYLTAVPNPGFSFQSWSINGILVSTDPSYTLQVHGNVQLNVHFIQTTPVYSVSITSYPAEGGTTIGQGEYTEGDTAYLTAVPNPGFSFQSWSINGILVSTDPSYTLQVHGNVQLNAHFIQTTPVYSVSITSYPAEGGTTIGQGEYTEGDTAYLTAVPNPGFSFQSWSINGILVGTEPVYFLIVESNVLVKAHFLSTTPTHMITTAASPSIGGNTTGDGYYPPGTTVIVVATPREGYVFVEWIDQGIPVSDEPSYTFEVAHDRNLTAIFDLTTEINEHEHLPVKIYPNPSTGHVYIESGQKIELKVLNALGQLILSVPIEESNQQLNIIESGIYYFQFRSKSGAYSNQKITVKK
jgi:hypothetical protein